MILANKNRDNFVLVDGSSYLYRAFYALPNLTTVSGFSTGAIHGVINMINKLIKTYEPKYLSVIFDPKGKTFRHDIYKEYKANRKSMPKELSEQVSPLMDFIKSLGISVLQIPDVEADDVIATLATKLSSKKNQIIISSSDKDLAQLVTQDVVLINSMDDKILNVDGVKEKFGVLPEQILDYLMLVGDSSDNIKVAFFLNFAFTILEIIGGLYVNSIAIISDAIHDLGDTISLGTSWYLEEKSHKKSNEKFSFGYKRFSLLGALINSVILIIGSLYVINEAVGRILEPEHTDAMGMIFFA